MNSRRFFCQLLAIAALSVSGLAARAAAPPTTGVGGTVISVNSGGLSFVLHPEHGADATVLTTAATVFKRTDGSTAAFSNLVPGLHVVVQGSTSTGSLVATQVLLVQAQPVPVHVTGSVSSVNLAALAFVVHPEHGADVTVTVNTATQFRKADQAASFADVTVGAVVVVTGTPASAAATILATQVVIQVPRVVTVSGTVAGIDPASLSFQLQPEHGTAVTVHTDSATQVKKGDAAATFGDLVLGAVVGVAGTQNSDGSLQAKLVKITGQQAVETGGLVVSVDAGALSFVIKPDHGANLTVTTGAATQYKKSDNSAATFADVLVGIRVYARGLLATDGSLAASGVIVVLPPLVQVGGTVSSINAAAASFVLHPEHGADVTVATTASTQFQKTDHSAAAFTSLTVGGHVLVQGYAATGVLTARGVLIAAMHAATHR